MSVDDHHQVTVAADDHHQTATKRSSQPPSSGSSNNNHNSSPPSVLSSIHAGYFRITISFGAQSLLWKALRHHAAEDDQDYSDDEAMLIRRLFRSLPSVTFLLLWSLSLLALLALSLLYALKCFFRFPAVRAEFSHHIGANYLYAPWISGLLLLQSAPGAATAAAGPWWRALLWAGMAAPVLALDLKIYGQWFTAEKRFLSTVANPTSQMSVMGNLAVAMTAATLGWKESAVAMFSLAAAHYFVLFVTLYQRLIGGGRFPALMRPSFFLFSAVPSLAALAWSAIAGDFDTPSKMLFFLSLFLFTSLACRPALFKKSLRRFNVVWWAYSFPLTFVALAASEYAKREKSSVASGLMLLLSVLSILVFVALMFLTALNTNALFAKNYSSSDYY